MNTAGGEAQRITLLGATGSIGASTLDVNARHPGRYAVAALAANRKWRPLLEQIARFRPSCAALLDADAAHELAAAARREGLPTRVLAGAEGLREVATLPGVDTVVAAIVGAAGLEPTLAAARAGKRILLANKETLVLSGSVFMAAVQEGGATLLPIDSEHNAVFQCLPPGYRGQPEQHGVRRILLTASGGPFRTWPIEAIRKVTVEQALKHPTWSMGPKITIDSATLMNKGLELIEARHLFGLEPDELDVVVHAQSVVHGLVEFRDGSVIAQLGSPDMRIPISHCLAWPARMGTPAPRLDLSRVSTLTFEEPDPIRFPALAIARRALAAGEGAPTVLNAANEIAVAEFVGGRLGFSGIPALVAATLDAATRRGEMAEPQSVEHAINIDHNARRLAAHLLPEIAAMAS